MDSELLDRRIKALEKAHTEVSENVDQILSAIVGHADDDSESSEVRRQLVDISVTCNKCGALLAVYDPIEGVIRTKLRHRAMYIKRGQITFICHACAEQVRVDWIPNSYEEYVDACEYLGAIPRPVLDWERRVEERAASTG